MSTFNKLRYIFDRRKKFQMLILVFIILIGTVFEFVGITAVLPLINAFIAPEQMLENYYVKLIYDWFRFDNITQFISFLTIAIIGVYVVKNVYIVWMQWIQSRFVFNGQRRMAYRLLSCYMHQPYLFHTAHNSSALLRNVNNDTAQLFTCVQSAIQLLTELSVCMVMFIVLIIQDPIITLVVAAALGGFMLVFVKVMNKRMVAYGQSARECTRDTNRWILQAFGGIKETIILERRNFFIRKYDNYSKTLMDTRRKQQFFSNLPHPIMEMTCIAGLLIAVLIKINTNTDMQSFIPTLSLFALAAFRLLPSFNRMSKNFAAITYSKASVDAVYEDLQLCESSAKLQETQNESAESIQLSQEIKVENVSFHYPTIETNVLDNVSISIPKNKSVAFIGPSGAGKTTLADIILGVLEPQQGKILVDGRDIRESMRSWHKKIGYIPQNIFLCDDTLRNNIAFGVRPGEVDDARVWKAIEEAQLKEFVDSLEKGVETVVGERGTRLSGGQRQRVGIARALYNNPDFLVLDEATSALDNETEKAVMESIDSLSGSKTLLIIAHRLTTIKKCDYIYEIKDQGAHLLSEEEWQNRLKNLADYEEGAVISGEQS